jgi:hypothetical protein
VCLRGGALCFGPLLFNAFSDDTRNIIMPPKFFSFADDIKIFNVVKSFDYCTYLQPCADSIRSWCRVNFVIFSTGKTGGIIFVAVLRTEEF